MRAYGPLRMEAFSRLAEEVILPNLDKLEKEGKIKVKKEGKKTSIELL